MDDDINRCRLATSCFKVSREKYNFDVVYRYNTIV